MQRRESCPRILLVALILGGVVVVTSGCGRRVTPGETDVVATATAGLAAAEATAGLAAAEATAERSVPGSAAKSHETPGQSAEPSCGVESSGTVADTGQRVTRDPKNGRQVIQVGQDLEGTVKRVSVTTLMKDPRQFEGRIVSVEGEVTAMCSHRRGWYAIVDSSGQVPLRIVTVPSFLVPTDAMGRRSRAQGTVETKELSEQAAGHLSRDHGLPEARRVVTLRAIGAEFR